MDPGPPTTPPPDAAALSQAPEKPKVGKAVPPIPKPKGAGEASGAIPPPPAPRLVKATPLGRAADRAIGREADVRLRRALNESPVRPAALVLGPRNPEVSVSHEDWQAHFAQENVPKAGKAVPPSPGPIEQRVRKAAPPDPLLKLRLKRRLRRRRLRLCLTLNRRLLVALRIRQRLRRQRLRQRLTLSRSLLLLLFLRMSRLQSRHHLRIPLSDVHLLLHFQLIFDHRRPLLLFHAVRKSPRRFLQVKMVPITAGRKPWADIKDDEQISEMAASDVPSEEAGSKMAPHRKRWMADDGYRNYSALIGRTFYEDRVYTVFPWRPKGADLLSPR